MAKEVYNFGVDGLRRQPDVNLTIQDSDYHKRTSNYYIYPKDAKLEGW